MTKLSIFYMMNFSSKPAHFTQLYTLLLVVFTGILSPFQFTLCTTNNTGILCPEAEMQALLSFKQTIGDPYNLLSSWNPQIDYCRWERLNCSKLSGHVLQLHLQNSMNPTNFSGTLNPSLVNLTQLRYLDLSINRFEGTLPAFIGSFANLEHLNISLAGFDANLPHTIGNLSNLRILSTRQPIFASKVDVTSVESLKWLSSLSNLEHLDMSYENLSQVHNWLQGKYQKALNFRVFKLLALLEISFVALLYQGLAATMMVEPMFQKKMRSKAGISEVEWMYIFVSLGYTVGISVVLKH